MVVTMMMTTRGEIGKILHPMMTMMTVTGEMEDGKIDGIVHGKVGAAGRIWEPHGVDIRPLKKGRDGNDGSHRLGLVAQRRGCAWTAVRAPPRGVRLLFRP